MNNILRTSLQMVFLFVGCGCDGAGEQFPLAPKPPSEANQPVHSEDEVSTTQPQALRNLQPTNLGHLPGPSSILDIHLVESLNVPTGGKLDEKAFRQLLESAKPDSVPQSSERSWAYAPWYSGTFTTPEGIHSFELYLGGRGILLLPDGRAGFFSFETRKR